MGIKALESPSCYVSSSSSSCLTSSQHQQHRQHSGLAYLCYDDFNHAVPHSSDY
ncbi:hypothetical protein K456DRAFT_1940562, partial [Colletotrichum gloeosporioides 23]